MRGDKGALRNRGHGSRDGPIGVRDVVDGGVVVIDVRIVVIDVGRVVVVDDCRVIDIGYGRSVDVSVADIDPVHIVAAHVVGRNVDFTRTQWEPSHINSNADASTDERYQSRGVNRFNVDGSGYPAPTSANADPAAVMKWGVAPGRVIYPSPSPGSDPRPVAFVVWSPSGIDMIGIPDVTVIRVVAPVAVVIKIFVADNIARQILR